ncbi:MAG TPA: hypothetical protein VEH84_04415 [Alphaproteobacteria bacterium]|nr:hypothetical protein [Alphaproteobacteria bacterium]
MAERRKTGGLTVPPTGGVTAATLKSALDFLHGQATRCGYPVAAAIISAASLSLAEAAERERAAPTRDPENAF